MYAIYGIRNTRSDGMWTIDPDCELLACRVSEQESANIVKRLFLEYKGKRYKDFYYQKIEDYPCIKELT